MSEKYKDYSLKEVVIRIFLVAIIFFTVAVFSGQIWAQEYEEKDGFIFLYEERDVFSRDVLTVTTEKNGSYRALLYSLPDDKKSDQGGFLNSENPCSFWSLRTLAKKGARVDILKIEDGRLRKITHYDIEKTH